jgi:hypothetical protein
MMEARPIMRVHAFVKAGFPSCTGRKISCRYFIYPVSELNCALLKYDLSDLAGMNLFVLDSNTVYYGIFFESRIEYTYI